MKLTAAQELDLSEIPAYIINEDGEGPLWKFNYGKYGQDPVPQVLVLGSYRNPQTGNLLIGGINTNYLNNRQKERLRVVLPTLMQAKNLYYRYHTGLNLLPDIFDSFYRTYDPNYIRAVDKSILYPKQSIDTAKRALAQAKLDKLRKSKEAQLQQAMPQYPNDISKMDKTLDQKTQDVATRRPQEQPSNEPEITNAKYNFANIKRARENAAKVKLAQAQHDAQEPQGYVAPEPNIIPSKQAITGNINKQPNATQELNRLRNQNQPDILEPHLQTRTRTDASAKPEFELEPTPTREPELVSNSDADFNISEPGIEESIVYYDPRYRRYIIEPAYELTSNWIPKFHP